MLVYFRRAMLIILVGPTAGGKTTLLNMLRAEGNYACAEMDALVKEKHPGADRLIQSGRTKMLRNVADRLEEDAGEAGIEA